MRRLYRLFSYFYSHVECKLATVKDYMIMMRVFVLLEYPTKRNLNDLEVEDMGGHLELLDGCYLGDMEDEDE